MAEAEHEKINMSGIEYRPPPPLKMDVIENLCPQWIRFKQSFKIFLTAAGYDRLAETRKAAILLNCVGYQAQDLYFNILKKSETSKYEDIIVAFDDYFIPKQNEVLDTFRFNMRVQEAGEPFDCFYSDVTKLIRKCNYEKLESRILRDKIVIGLHEKKLQQRLLEVKDLTLEKAVDICRSSELSEQHVKLMSRSSVAVDAVQSKPGGAGGRKMHFNKLNTVNQDKYKNNVYKCLKCNTQHGLRSCPAYGKTCSFCKKPNHFSVGCKFKKKLVQSIDVDNKSNGNNENDL
ncbi:uncharacterized protein LOC123669368 [Melitaea cinxia]|uniref:uncharacterized protein LOC123669368 n=1 Tax=Melitaea cinxia TaxID=113334 RepID=UPI001E27395E|nr:uncharacterized protein LOC123669368 [Melitaea cinxia]